MKKKEELNPEENEQLSVEKLRNEQTDEIKNEKVEDIVEKAKKKGSMTYGELASELEDVNPDQIDKVFDAFEKSGVDLLETDFDEEPDIEDLNAVEEISIEEMNSVTDFEGISVDDPVRMYLREIGKIPLLSYDEEEEDNIFDAVNNATSILDKEAMDGTVEV